MEPGEDTRCQFSNLQVAVSTLTFYYKSANKMAKEGQDDDILMAAASRQLLEENNAYSSNTIGTFVGPPKSESGSRSDPLEHDDDETLWPETDTSPTVNKGHVVCVHYTYCRLFILTVDDDN